MNIKNNIIKLIGLLFICLTFCSWESSNNEETPNRTKVNINENWTYLENDTDNLKTALNQSNWENVNLPHTWNALDATDLDPGYRRNGSWYKKQLNIQNIESNTLYQLYFEGANITSEIYVNGEKAGEHIGGYIGFTIDITTFIKSGDNEILVRVDNSYDPEVIPSQKSDFFIFGGITRDVWLETLPIKHLSKLQITTPKVSAKQAELLATVSIENGGQKHFKIKAELIDPNGGKVQSSVFSVKDNTAKIHFKNIKNPKLWDTENPNLYTLKVTLLDKGAVIDELTDRVGFRWFEFKDHGAFYLNGKRLLLRGTHRHEEHAGVGAAMSNMQHRADMELIKEMGTNFVRLAHYPQDPEIYKACDELGLLVWDELPWCRGGVGNAVWKTNTKTMLEEIITQNYNHPSIIIWSLGNEMYWLPDFEDGDNPTKMNTFLTELNTLAHTLDPYRKTAIRKYYEGSNIVDVFSPSIWSGWYSGSYKSYQKAIDTYKKEYPHFLHAEYGGSSHVGRHTENPITGEGNIQSDGWEEEIVQTDVANIAQIGDWSENYIVDLFDWHLRISENDEDFVGNVQWAFKDFGTPLRPENDIPYMNQKGLVDRAGNPKDAFYVFKSYWSNDPFTYIESHTWTERQGPEGLSRTISVYSNCPEVELFLNGKSLGVKKRDTKVFPAAGLNWELNFDEGENKLVAVGKTEKSKDVKDELSINYRYTKNGKAVGLKLESEILENGNYLITATAYDGDGLRCLDYENRVYFQCLSGGETLKSQGTPTGSESIAMANGKASIEVKRNSVNKSLEMMVMNQSFKGTYLTIE
ncbi:glycoside hydrolase family 2 protein [Formosa sp. PL04]|uniref:glycoside hydrolase family 2 protein n=1 Tax=Formosa sp. PL04 TaxID=3081755 RepID=UPI0029826A56|nr:glycoside hydrolase family 2 TIM barrel-domain containing protein [Formosa sp. PL04]MDW5290942.1 glycoside hydrolase family 2 TIM barrel-domain containing protein [Formosa sp. PL04]